MIRHVSSAKWNDCEKNEDHWYILKKEGDPEQTPEASDIENFVFQTQIHLLLQMAFC